MGFLLRLIFRLITIALFTVIGAAIGTVAMALVTDGPMPDLDGLSSFSDILIQLNIGSAVGGAIGFAGGTFSGGSGRSANSDGGGGSDAMDHDFDFD